MKLPHGGIHTPHSHPLVPPPLSSSPLLWCLQLLAQSNRNGLSPLPDDGSICQLPCQRSHLGWQNSMSPDIHHDVELASLGILI